MKKLKSIIRAVSPFGGWKPKPAQDTQVQSDDQEDESIATYTWRLDNINMNNAMTKFYMSFNPEKVHKVKVILDKFKGDENVLLQQLCQRYHVSPIEMQKYLDSSRTSQDNPHENGSVSGSTSQPKRLGIRKASPSVRPSSAYNHNTKPITIPEMPYRFSKLDDAPQRFEFRNCSDEDVGNKPHDRLTSGNGNGSANLFSANKEAIRDPHIPSETSGDAEKEITSIFGSGFEYNEGRDNAIPTVTEFQGTKLDGIRSRQEHKASPPVHNTMQDLDTHLNVKLNVPESGNGTAKPVPLPRNIDSAVIKVRTPDRHTGHAEFELQAVRAELEKTKSELQKACADRTEVLNILEIVSAAPVNVRTVLDAYLSQYGNNTSKVSGSSTTLEQPALLTSQKFHQSESLSSFNVGAGHVDSLARPIASIDKRRFSPALSKGLQSDDPGNPFIIQDSERTLLQNLNINSSKDFSSTKGSPIQVHRVGGSPWSYLPHKESKSRWASPLPAAQYMKATKSELQRISTDEGTAPVYSWDQQLRGNTNSRSSTPTVPSSSSLKRDDEMKLGTGVSHSAQLDQQYNLARQFYLHGLSQSKIAERLATGNVALTGQEDYKSSRFRHLPERESVSAERAVRSTSKPRESTAHGNIQADDWIECFDPRNRKNYYHSPSLRVSTWKKPSVFTTLTSRSTSPAISYSADVKLMTGYTSNNPGVQSTSKSVAASSRSSSGRRSSTFLASASVVSSSCNIKEQIHPDLLASKEQSSSRIVSDRDASPSDDTVNDSSTISTNFTKRPISSDRGGSRAREWSSAVDPVSQRVYWYNRMSKETTWRKPRDI